MAGENVKHFLSGKKLSIEINCGTAKNYMR